MNRVRTQLGAAANLPAVSISFLTPPAVGNGLLIGVMSSHIAALPPTACVDNQTGNTYIRVESFPNGVFAGCASIFYCPKIVAAAGTFTITITDAAAGNRYWTAAVVEVADVGGGLAVDMFRSAGPGVGTSVAGLWPLVAGYHAHTMQFIVCALQAAQTAIAISAGTPAWIEECQTLSPTGPGWVGEIDSRVLDAVPTSAELSFTWTLSASSWWSYAAAGFYALPAAGDVGGVGGGLTPHTWSLTIAGVDRTSRVMKRTLKGAWTRGGRGTLTFSVFDLNTGASAWHPALDALVILTVDGVVRFRGFITDIGETPLGGIRAGTRQAITCGDYSMMLDRVYITKEYGSEIIAIYNSAIASPTFITCASPHPFIPGDKVLIEGHVYSVPDINGPQTVGAIAAANTFYLVGTNVTVAGGAGTVRKYYTLKQIIQDIATTYLTTNYGITLDPTLVDGPIMAPVSFTDVTALEALNQLTAAAGFVWRVTPGLVLQVFTLGSKAAGFNLDGANVHGPVQVQKSRRRFANRVIVKFGGDRKLVRTHTFPATGSAPANYTVPFPVSKDSADTWPNTLVLDGVPGADTISWGPDPAFRWYWDVENHRLVNTAAPTAAAGQIISVTFTAQYPATVTVENITDVQPPPTGRGPWEEKVEVPTVTEIAQAQVIADQVLAQQYSDPRELQLATYTGYAYPGDAVGLTFANHLVSGSWHIESASFSLANPKFFWYEYAFIEGGTILKTWVDDIKEITGGTTGGGTSSGSTAVSMTGSPLPPTGSSVTGTGTAGQLTKWSGATVLGDSGLTVSAGLLTGGGTGAGFTINLATSTISGLLPVANLPIIPRNKLPAQVAYTDVINTFITSQVFTAPSTSAIAWRVVGRPSDNTSLVDFVSAAGSTIYSQFQAHSGGMIISGVGDLQFIPNGNLFLRPGSHYVFGYPGYSINLGSIQLKYKELHAAELWVETLVAQETIATIGGRILVGPTTSLARDLVPGDNKIYVKHNFFKLYLVGLGELGDKLYMEAAGKVESMVVTQTTTPTAEADGSFGYDVARGWDFYAGVPSTRNTWYAGDAVFDSGKIGDGFIDLYSLRGIHGGSEPGPTIVGNVRYGHYGFEWSPRWAIGNLNGLYGRGDREYGVAFGDYAGVHVTMTVGPPGSNHGFRIKHGTGDRFYADTDGNLWLAGDLTIGAAGIFHTAAAGGLDTGIGIWMQGGATPTFRVGNPDGNRIRWATDGTLTIRSATVLLDAGGITITSIPTTFVSLQAYNFTSPTFDGSHLMGVYAIEEVPGGAYWARTLSLQNRINYDAHTAVIINAQNSLAGAGGPRHATIGLHSFSSVQAGTTQIDLDSDGCRITGYVTLGPSGASSLTTMYVDNANSFVITPASGVVYYFRDYGFFPSNTFELGMTWARWGALNCTTISCTGAAAVGAGINVTGNVVASANVHVGNQLIFSSNSASFTPGAGYLILALDGTFALYAKTAAASSSSWASFFAWPPSVSDLGASGANWRHLYVDAAMMRFAEEPEARSVGFLERLAGGVRETDLVEALGGPAAARTFAGYEPSGADTPAGVDYTKFVPMLITAVRDLAARLRALEP